MSGEDLERLYQAGVEAVRAGDKATAREKLSKVVERDQFHEGAWMWLSAAVESNEERIVCLENALTINPGNEAARRGLRKLGVEPPEAPPEAAEEPPAGVPLAHSAPDVIDGSMQALLTGTPRPPDEPKKADLPPDEAWRAALYESQAVESDAAYIPPKAVAPELTLTDLTNVWIDLLYFNVYGKYEDEVKHGGFPHVLVNIASAWVLQVVAAVLFCLILFVLPGNLFKPPLLTSTESLMEQATGRQVDLVPQGSTSGLAAALEVLGVTSPGEAVSGSVNVPGVGTAQLVARIAGSLLLALITFAVITLPLLVIGQMFDSVILQGVANLMNATGGDTMQTLHALSLSLVASRIVQVGMAIILPFLPFGVALTIAGLLWVYQFAIAASAVGKIYNFSVLSSMAAIAFGKVAGGFVIGAGFFVISLLAGL